MPPCRPERGADMSEKTYRSGLCPKCGGELRVPEELNEFSCMYCGARLTPEALLTQAAEPMNAEAAARAFEAAAGRLAGCIRDFPGYNRKIVRDQFEGAFAEYEAKTREVFEQLDSAVRAREPEREALLDAAAERMLDDLAAAWQADPKWSRKASRDGIRDDDKIILAIFFVPALRRQKLSVSEPLSERLQQKWVARYPESPFFLGDYESIFGGFRKKFLGLCFITTAVCEAEGLPDDCAELTAFRAFRDGYLRGCPDGPALIDEYYNIAPGIVSCIDVCSDRAAKYAAIRDTWLSPCYRDLMAGRMEQCKARYTEMVRSLEKEYLS